MQTIELEETNILLRSNESCNFDSLYSFQTVIPAFGEFCEMFEAKKKEEEERSRQNLIPVNDINFKMSYCNT